jgi:hypothetical protein
MSKKLINSSLIGLTTLIPYLYFFIYTFHSSAYILSMLELSAMLNYSTISGLNAGLSML